MMATLPPGRSRSLQAPQVRGFVGHNGETIHHQNEIADSGRNQRVMGQAQHRVTLCNPALATRSAQ